MTIIAKPYVLIKNDMYYRPSYSGYTFLLEDAGMYTKELAEAHAAECDEVTCKPASECPRFSPAFPDFDQVQYLLIKEAVLEKLIERKNKEIANLVGWYSSASSLTIEQVYAKVEKIR